MGKAAAPLAKNDGAIVVALVLLMAGLCAVMFSAVALYASADVVLSKAQKEKTVRARRLARLLSGWANMANAVTHALLIVMLLTDTERYKIYFPDEAEMPIGPVILGIINGLVGIKTLTGKSIVLALSWNSFVAVMGSLLPLVWPKFIDVGMTEWPYLAIFLWLGIYAFESTAFFFSAVAFSLKDVVNKAD